MLPLPDATPAEENYLKAIYKRSRDGGPAAPNTLSAELNTAPASVTDMLKRLHDKRLLMYTPYKGAELTDEGLRLALYVLRKHRLWETFLVEKLRFNWDEVHETAEQLEHVRSPKLIERLDEFLGFPPFDPHGDPIPDAEGNMPAHVAAPLSQAPAGAAGVIVAVTDDSPAFLQYLDVLGIQLGVRLTVTHVLEYDGSRVVECKGAGHVISPGAAAHLLLDARQGAR